MKLARMIGDDLEKFFVALVRQAKPGQSSNLKGGCHVKSR